ncbi:hypothetical protein B0H11DRAFT_1899861 [Mycena galericulata]|nr:hypothetical protein B0H11DRAFT_1899861 [Mycena galericulata]
MLSSTFSCAAIFLTLCSYAIAAPLNNLEARTDCADGNPSPCICGGAKGIRKKTLQCGNQSFKFTDPASPTDGTVSLVPSDAPYQGNSGSLQCDHIVELQFIANEIDKVAAIWKASFDTFFDTINAVPNLIFVESTVNNAKGIVLGGKSFVDTTSKAASGVVSYLKLLEANGAKNTNPGTHVATTIDTAMTIAVGVGSGFTSGFQSRWDAAVTAAIKTFVFSEPTHSELADLGFRPLLRMAERTDIRVFELEEQSERAACLLRLSSCLQEPKKLKAKESGTGYTGGFDKDNGRNSRKFLDIEMTKGGGDSGKRQDEFDAQVTQIFSMILWQIRVRSNLAKMCPAEMVGDCGWP